MWATEAERPVATFYCSTISSSRVQACDNCEYDSWMRWVICIFYKNTENSGQENNTKGNSNH